MNLLLRTLLLHPINIVRLYFHYCLYGGIFWFLSWFHFWPIVFIFLSSMLFNFYELIIFFSLQLISGFITLLSEKMLGISIFLNLLRFVMWFSMFSILENVPCAHLENVYSAVFGCSVLYISLMSNWSFVSFRTSVALLMLCL